MLGRWLREPNDGTVVVFLHGLFSSTDTAWRSRKAFWPDLLREEEALRDAGIYLFDYETRLTSGTYSVGDVTDALNAYFDIHNLWRSRFIIFVAHSMGGIVARYLLVSRQQKFASHGIKTGFYLVASPSLGSAYATIATNLGLIHNVQLDGLKFSEANVWLNELDKNFRNLKEGGSPVIVGRELGEADAIILKSFFFGSKKIVTPASAYRYFGDPLVVPGSDHISIAKPADRNSLQHQLLIKFIRDNASAAAQPPPAPARKIRIVRNDLPVTGTVFVGRGEELKLLTEGWEGGKLKILTIKAMGGTGKTALTKRFLDRLAANNWPSVDGVFCWSFDSQGNSDDRRQVAVNAFYEAAFEFLDHQGPLPASQNKKARLLADLLSERRILFILDGLEPLQFSPAINNGELRDKSLATFLMALADSNRGLCIVTSRQDIHELRDMQATARLLDLNQLAEADAVELLQSRGVKGAAGEMLAAAREFGLHALSINLLAGYLTSYLGGDIRLRQEVKPEHLFDKSEIGARAEFVMEAYARRFEGGKNHHLELPLLYLVGLFDRPAPGEAVSALLAEPAIAGISDCYLAMSAQQRAQNFRVALERLRTLDLLNPVDPIQKGDLDAHPLVRAYFGRRLRDRRGASWTAAHERLFKYYEVQAVPKPKDARQLELTFQALGHACKSENVGYAYDNFLAKRIRAATNAAGEKIADHGALVSAYANFFDELWSKPSQSLDRKKQRSLLGAASFSLKASGHQRRALEPLEKLLAEMEADKSPDHAALAIVARRACEIRMNLGFLTQAEALAQKALRYADKTGRLDLRSAMRASVGDVAHQLGRLADAGTHFNAANQLFRRENADVRWIEAEAGYKYAEYLATSQKTATLAPLAAQFEEQARKPRTPGIFRGYSHFVNALSLFSTGKENARLAYYEVENAHDYFARTGATEYMARCLKLGARLLRANGEHGEARRELAEAHYLASTYDFRLLLADCLIETAELSLCDGAQGRSEARNAAAMAKSIIDSAQYGRRKGDIADLERRLR